MHQDRCADGGPCTGVVHGPEPCGRSAGMCMTALAGPAFDHLERMSERGDGGPLVLLVDDFPSLREVGRRLLERAGFRVRTAGDGAAALDLAAAEVFDAAVVDVRLPGLSGPILAGLLRERQPGMALILTSGADEPSATEDLGAIFVPKVDVATRLVPAVRQVLAGRPSPWTQERRGRD